MKLMGIKLMGQMKNSHSFCEKLGGPTTSPSRQDAGTIRSENSTFGAAENMAGQFALRPQRQRQANAA